MFIRDHLFLPIAPADDARVVSMAFLICDFACFSAV